MNLPNKLTVGRIVCAVVMMVFLLLEGSTAAWLAAALYALASLTDLADGQIARRRGLVTDLGKFMDPLADKILNYSVMVLLLPEGLIPAVALALILFREFLVSGLRMTAAEQGVAIAANLWGKVKTVVQDLSLAAILVLRALGVGALGQISQLLIWICAALTVVSGAVYLAQNAGLLKEK